jgi:integrase/recombinase XerD
MTYDEWLDAKGRSLNTRLTYGRVLAQFDNPADDLEVAQYFADHAAASPSTLQVVRAALRSYAKYRGHPDPTMSLLVRRAKPTLPRPMPMRDVQKLLGHAHGRDRVMLELLLHGLRRHEVAKLTTDNIEYDGDTVALRFVGKGGYEGTVVLNEDTGARLMAYLAGSEDFERWLGARKRPEPLFRTTHGAMTNREVNRMFVKHRDGAGLSQKWGPHSLRHTCGTELVEREVDIRVVQEVLRHKDIRMTMGYTKVTRGAKTRAAARIPIPR